MKTKIISKFLALLSTFTVMSLPKTYAAEPVSLDEVRCKHIYFEFMKIALLKFQEDVNTSLPKIFIRLWEIQRLESILNRIIGASKLEKSVWPEAIKREWKDKYYVEEAMFMAYPNKTNIVEALKATIFKLEKEIKEFLENIKNSKSDIFDELMEITTIKSRFREHFRR